MDSRERQQAQLFKQRRITAGPSISQKLESMSVQEMHIQRNNYLTNQIGNKFATNSKPAMPDLRTSNSQTNIPSNSSNNSPIRGANQSNGGPMNFNFLHSAGNNTPGVIPVTLTKRRIGPRITNVQAHIVASKQLFLQLQSFWNKDQLVDNFQMPLKD